VSIHPQLAARFRHLDGLTSMREAYTTMAGLEKIRRFDNWEPATTLPTVTTRDMAAPGPHGPVPVRVYEPPVGVLADLPCLVWLHGGGFAGGDLEMNEADWTAREVCGRAGAVVVSVDYRLAQGEINYPLPHDDAVAAVAWVRDSATELGVDQARITLGGASAGGNLSAGAALKLRDRDAWMPSALLLVYAVFHPVVPAPSRSLAALLAELPTVYQEEPGNDTSFVTVNYLGGPLSSADGYAMPGLAVLNGLCPTVLINAEYDNLRSSGEAFAAQLALAGVDVRQVLVPEMLHAFLNCPSYLDPVGRGLDLMAEVVRTAGRTRQEAALSSAIS
jgi:acetyl esterase